MCYDAYDDVFSFEVVDLEAKIPEATTSSFPRSFHQFGYVAGDEMFGAFYVHTNDA